jgi:DNA modification methylase
MEVNKIYNENCLDTMAKIPNGFIDLVVTSPPYDGMRTLVGVTKVI